MDKEKLLQLVAERKTIREIADVCATSYTNIRYWLKKYKLKTRCGPHGKKHDWKENYQCPCGEKDPSKFYGNKIHICGRCHSAYSMRKGKEIRNHALEALGGQCKECGYKKCPAALDIHHLDPKEKDPAWSHMRSWSWGRVSRELKKCILVCKNCHAEIHAADQKMNTHDTLL